MVSIVSDSSILVAPLATMFLSLRQYSLNCNTQKKLMQITNHKNNYTEKMDNAK